jgi:hypothetical protein
LLGDLLSMTAYVRNTYKQKSLKRERIENERWTDEYFLISSYRKGNNSVSLQKLSTPQAKLTQLRQQQMSWTNKCLLYLHWTVL